MRRALCGIAGTVEAHLFVMPRRLRQCHRQPNQFPTPRMEFTNVDLTEIEPVERRVDTLLRAETDEGTYLLVVESQGKKDEAKQRSWPYYLSYLYAKYDCDRC